MSKRYIVKAERGHLVTPYPNLPGSPFGSKIQAKDAAKSARIADPIITSVARRPHAD